jgi:hypothetical protein
MSFGLKKLVIEFQDADGNVIQVSPEVEKHYREYLGMIRSGGFIPLWDRHMYSEKRHTNIHQKMYRH